MRSVEGYIQANMSDEEIRQLYRNSSVTEEALS
jgi:hypothetical protein